MNKADLLFEIGVEEMPSAPLIKAAAELEERARSTFEQAKLAYDSLEVNYSPRRLCLVVTGLETEQADSLAISRGPAAAIAYDEQGNFTKAAEGFARGKGLSAADLILREHEGVNYLFAEQHIAGKKTAELLPEMLFELISALNWPKAMRWGCEEVKFIRPIRWILSLFDGAVVDCSYGSLQSSNKSYGHRFLAPEAFEVSSYADYQEKLYSAFVVLDHNERKTQIVYELHELAEPFGSLLLDESVLEEVVNLVEYPNAILASFDEEFLQVPAEILLSAMSKHQRYFAIQKADGSLDNHFIVVSNGSPAAVDTIRNGHERVLRARLYDAHFFVEEDLKVSLEEWKLKLASLLFQAQLGSLLDKTERIEALSAFMADSYGQSAQRAEIIRGAELAKADLVSNAVVEFTELQGIMGSHYAKAQGESELVADIIREHYLPRFANDAIPATTAARIVSLADKIDTTVGIILIGKAPTGSSDPFAIRRNAIGMISILRAEPDFNLLEIAEKSFELYRNAGLYDEERAQAWKSFVLSRFTRILRDEGYSHDLVEAILSRFEGSIVDSTARVQALKAFIDAKPDFSRDLLIALSRAYNLHDESVGTQVDTSLCGAFEEKLMAAIDSADQVLNTLLAAQDYEASLERLAELKPAVDDFFENLMVLDKDEKIKRNRLAILNRLVALFDRFGDLTKVELSND